MYLQECLSCSHKPAKIRAQDRQNTGGATLAEYEYLADGSKLRALDGGGNGYQYRGSLIYTQTAGQSDSPVITLDCALTSAGRIVRETSAAGTVSYRPLIHLRDHLGSVRAVIDGDTGTVVETSDYYPFGKRIQVTAPVSEPVGGSQYASEPAVAPVAPATSVASTSSPNRWHFSGKEDQSFLNAGIPLLDFGARMYNPAIARWTAADPLSEKYYGISPYVYCLNNPTNSFDPDGKAVWFIPLIKGVVGAAVDAGAQVTVSLSAGKTFMESLKSVDLTSVGTSFITSAVISPGASKGLKAAVVGANLLDAGVDYSIDDGTKTVFDEKNIGKATVEFTLGIASGLASNGVQKAFEKDTNAKLAPSAAAPLTKAERASLRSRRDFVKSEKFQIILDETFSFTFGMTGNTIVEFIPPPKDVKDEKEEQ